MKKCKFLGAPGCRGSKCKLKVAECSLYKSLGHALRYKENAEKIKKQTAEYRETVRATPRVIVRQALDRHERLGFAIKVSLEEATSILENTSQCRYCGREMTRNRKTSAPTSISLDRINNGKTLTRDNIQFICRECNSTKGARTHAQFVAYMKEALRLTETYK